MVRILLTSAENQQGRVQNQFRVEEEIRRVIPVIESLAKKISIPISIDTYKSDVAEAALQAGAVIVNDISAMTFDAKMASVVTKHQAQRRIDAH